MTESGIVQQIRRFIIDLDGLAVTVIDSVKDIVIAIAAELVFDPQRLITGDVTEVFGQWWIRRFDQ